ncbi:hypothetical protein RFI_03766 [Reticulomyxa filosa]|uniref:Uncharacterized protein n=1 Tax=Reticulomyxa filosa TaxID=46433 RepID=X6P459_RETFI|nr:hypothetical protein RFI_03766 [Reticulomyxa filosa]|eukprot:ETO33340.1 hypothetical protein RFI_03766 [Reticulomyxa filosa]
MKKKMFVKTIYMYTLYIHIILRELDNAYFEGIIKPNKISGRCPSSESQLMSFADAAEKNQFAVAVSFSQKAWQLVSNKEKSNSTLENLVNEWVKSDLETIVKIGSRNDREGWVNVFKSLDARMSAHDTKHMNEWRLSENFRCAAHWWAKKCLTDKLNGLCEQYSTIQQEELEAEQISGWDRLSNRVKGLETDVQLSDHVVAKFMDQLEDWTMEKVTIGTERLTGIIWKKAFESSSCEYAYQLITNPIQTFYETFNKEFDTNTSYLKSQPLWNGKTILEHIKKNKKENIIIYFFFFS